VDRCPTFIFSLDDIGLEAALDNFPSCGLGKKGWLAGCEWDLRLLDSLGALNCLTSSNSISKSRF
jgi:hypothetical protein